MKCIYYSDLEPGAGTAPSGSSSSSSLSSRSNESSSVAAEQQGNLVSFCFFLCIYKATLMFFRKAPNCFLFIDIGSKSFRNPLS